MENYNKKFKDKFDEFEKFIKNKFHNDTFNNSFVQKNYLLQNNQEFWKHCISLRNIYAHSEGIKFTDITKKSYFMFCAETEKIMKPKLAYEIAIKSVYKVQECEPVCDIIFTMLDKNYTCTPVVNDKDVVIGVFTSHSLMKYIHSKNCKFSLSNPIGDLMDYCKTNGDRDIEYKFVSKITPEYDIRKYFKDTYDNKKRLEAIFVTKNGKQEEELLGIITNWDLHQEYRDI